VISYATAIIALLLLIAAISMVNRYRYIHRTNKIIQSEKARSDELLLNILPAETAKELALYGSNKPRYYESVSVLFSDFKGFSAIASKLTPQELVAELNDFFVAFDDIVVRYNLEKIKTIGDSYMCAGGIPTAGTSHPLNTVQAAIAMQKYINKKNEEWGTVGRPLWELRIGINTGPVVAGVVGKMKYAYDIWGDTVNIASRMESNGQPGKVNISSATYALIKDKYSCEYRGKISAKNIGDVDMYFIEKEILVS
jgi:adenylate cyclase